MFRRFVLLKEAVKHCMALIGREWPIIRSEDWDIMEEVCESLQPFEEVISTVNTDEVHGKPQANLSAWDKFENKKATRKRSSESY
ncbi:jg6921 [Pararge aegeria aegeria]|uniref:Jg6921 protein n=1 Tax=Pararge aegeria aegeria TaxID=348720 RepID=A0A8S4QTM7_9NEOP|nr:jg6921 [Pararge aegeria aegeria]